MEQTCEVAEVAESVSEKHEKVVFETCGNVDLRHAVYWLAGFKLVLEK